MSRRPAGMDPNADIAVEEIRDGATVHLPHGCPEARLIEVKWCPKRGCYSSPTFSPSPSREVIPHAQHA